MIDPFGRSIHYARLSVTDLCNLRCRYCMPEEGVEKKDHRSILRIEDLLSITAALADLGIDKIRITGGEPLVRHGILTLIEGIASMPRIRDLALTSNGTLLPELAKPLKSAGLRRVNISLDTFDNKKYAYMTRGGDVAMALAGIQAARNAGFERVKLNTVLMKGFNDDEIPSFAALTRTAAMDVRFIEIMPFEGQQTFAAGSFLPADHVLAVCPDLVPEKSDDPSAPARYYRFPGAPGRVGLIEPMSHRFCGACNRLRVTADGQLLTCLHNRRQRDLRPWIGDPAVLRAVIRDEIEHKPGTHRIDEGQLMDRDMGHIGG